MDAIIHYRLSASGSFPRIAAHCVHVFTIDCELQQTAQTFADADD